MLDFKIKKLKNKHIKFIQKLILNNPNKYISPKLKKTKKILKDKISYGIFVNEDLIAFNLSFFSNNVALKRTTCVISHLDFVSKDYTSNGLQKILHKHRDGKINKSIPIITRVSPLNVRSLKNILNLGFQLDKIVIKNKENGEFTVPEESYTAKHYIEMTNEEISKNEVCLDDIRYIMKKLINPIPQ